MDRAQTEMYVPLIMLSYAVGLLLLLVGSRTIDRTIPRLRGLKEMQFAILAGIAAVLLIGARPWLPIVLSVLIGNYALFTCFLLMYLSAARVTRSKPSHIPWLIALAISSLPVLCFLTWIRPNLLWRVVLTTELLAIVPLATAIVLFRKSRPASADSAAKIAWLQVASAAFLTIRSALSYMYPPSDFIHGDLIQIGFILGQFTLCLMTICGIIWLAFCDRHAEVESFALTDSLSGLLNRRAFDEVFSRECERNHGGNSPVALILLDIDHFKQINDVHGHLIGDSVICKSAEVMKRTVRPGDTVARYGGDEFAVLLRNATLNQVAVIAERLRKSIEESATSGEIAITASLGVGMCDPMETAAEFLDRCDRALYRSKESGRNCIEVSGASLTS